MKAMVRDAYGPPDVLELRGIDLPACADDEILVRVRAAGVCRDVWHVMTGLPYPIRLAGYGFRAPKNPIIGQPSRMSLRTMMTTSEKATYPRKR